MVKRDWSRGAAIAAVAVLVAAEVIALSASQKPGAVNRFGRWKLDSEAAPPASNIMTYEPWGDGGMKVTVSTVSAQGQKSEWSYETLFDGVFRPVTGQQNSETAVEFINDRSTRIQNKRNGRVTQVIINTLSEDRNTISNEYVRFDENGRITVVTHAVYRRMQ